MTPINLHFEKKKSWAGKCRLLSLGGTQKIINKVFVGNVSKRV